jgi:hypothetical protein
MPEVKGTLRLAQLAAESLVGAERVRLEAVVSTSEDARSITIDQSGKAGRMLALIFSGYARREFGDLMTVEHAASPDVKPAGLKLSHAIEAGGGPRA